MNAPDKNWLPFMRMGLGYFIVLVIAVIALAIGLGKVEEKTSFGLQGIIGGLSVLAGGVANYAFRSESKPDKED